MFQYSVRPDEMEIIREKTGGVKDHQLESICLGTVFAVKNMKSPVKSIFFDH